MCVKFLLVFQTLFLGSFNFLLRSLDTNLLPLPKIMFSPKLKIDLKYWINIFKFFEILYFRDFFRCMWKSGIGLALFCDLTQRRMLFPYRRIGTICGFHFKGQAVQSVYAAWTDLPLKMEAKCFFFPKRLCRNIILRCVRIQKSAYLIYIAAEA
jgi:hypothetical protein